MCQAHLGYFRHILHDRSSVVDVVIYFTLDLNFKPALTFT